MKVIFLDIDGVLNSNDFVCSQRFEAKADKGFPDSHLDENAIARINKLCEETGAKIVLSSTWRSIDNVLEVLKRNGLKADIVDKTPNLDRKLESGLWTSKIRGDEIQAWLDENECEQYLIIDDDRDMLEKQKERFICTDAEHGFTKKQLHTAIEMLQEV